MLGYALRRLTQLIPVLVLASIIVFSLLRWIPGDPAMIMAGPDASPEVVAAVRQQMGLDQPLVNQYLIWMSHAVQGDLGKSFVSRQPVLDLIGRRLPATVELAVAATVLAVITAIPLGIIAAVRQRSIFDYVVSALNGVSLAVPNFWLGILLVLVFSLYLRWLPPFGWADPFSDPAGGLRFLILPALTLSMHISAVLARFTRVASLEVLRQDYVRTAYSKGLGERPVIAGHVLRNALIPVVTVLGIQFGQMLGGVVIVEAVFSWPGIGQLVLQAILNRDYTVVQGALLVSVGLFLLINLLTDMVYGFIDPRIRLAHNS